jgi:integrase/recombinase XerD
MPATFKLVLAPRADSDGLHDARLRITVARITRFQNTGIAVPEKQWNAKATLLTKNWVRTAHRKHEDHNKDLLRWLDRAQSLAQEHPGWSADQLKGALRNGDLDPNAPDFLAFCRQQLAAEQQLLDEAHAKRRPTTGLSQATIVSRTSVINKLAAWHGGPLPLPLFTTDLIKKYEGYLLHTLDNEASTTAKNLKELRVFIRLAIRAKLLKPQDDPMYFYDYPTSKPKRVWLEKTEVVDFETVVLSPAQHLARTVYFLQHYAHGSRIGVILRLQWKDRAHGRLKFTMDKGGREKDVEETPALTALLDSLRPAGIVQPEAYILPYLPADFDRLHPREQLGIIKRETGKINENLKLAAAKLGIDKKLSSHVARRTLATLGDRALRGNLGGVGGLLGHKHRRTTEIYLQDLDTFEVDAAARTVYDSLSAGTTAVQQIVDTSEQASVRKARKR